MIVGTHLTGEGRYGPVPVRVGIQAGTLMTGSEGDACHGASLKLSQPHPAWVSGLVPCRGLSPVKPSRRLATSSMCAPKLWTRDSSNVASEIAYVLARRARLGIAFSRYWL